MDDLIQAGLEEERQRNEAYSEPTPTGAAPAKLAGNYLPSATTYKFYELNAPLDQEPAILVFSKASADILAPTRIFRVGSDINYRQVYWTAVRKNDWPVIPEVDESDGPLLHRRIDPIAPPVASADGDILLFRISGRYVYVLEEPQDPSAEITGPKLPFLALDDDRRIIGSDALENLTTISQE